MNLNLLPEYVRIAVIAAQDKKAENIVVLDLTSVGGFTSYFVLCTAFSTPQIQAVCSEIEEQIEKNLQRTPAHREGRGSPDWALLDFGGFVVHVFSEQARKYYDLERLWRNALRLEVPSEPNGWTSSGTKNFPDAGGDEWHPSGETASK